MAQDVSYNLAVVCVLLAAAIGLGLSTASGGVVPDQYRALLPQRRTAMAAAMAAILFSGCIIAAEWRPATSTGAPPPGLNAALAESGNAASEKLVSGRYNPDALLVHTR